MFQLSSNLKMVQKLKEVESTHESYKKLIRTPTNTIKTKFTVICPHHPFIIIIISLPQSKLPTAAACLHHSAAPSWRQVTDCEKRTFHQNCFVVLITVVHTSKLKRLLLQLLPLLILPLTASGRLVAPTR
jgi:hypothetical protein